MTTDRSEAVDLGNRRDLPIPPVPHVNVEQRLAVLEERTAPRPKTAFDHIKSWGGLTSLAIALIYSFPLGLWDRFIVGERENSAKELAALREAIDESLAMVSSGAQSVSSISDPTLRDMVQRGVTTRLYMLMAKHRQSLEDHRSDFVPPELLVIGYSFLMTNQTEAALSFFQAAEERANYDPATKLEARRMRAKALFLPGPNQKRDAARKLFSEAIAEAQLLNDPIGILGYITLAADWGLLELQDGDWLCGEQQISAARARYEQSSGILGDDGHFLRVLDKTQFPLKRRAVVSRFRWKLAVATISV